MSGIFQKKITESFQMDFIKCDKCNRESPFATTIDWWITHEGDNYCLGCQKTHDLGHYEPKKGSNT